MRSPYRRIAVPFLAVLLALSIPIWLIGPVVETLMSRPAPIQLPVSAVMAVCPAISAMILIHRRLGGLQPFILRAFRVQSPIAWLPWLVSIGAPVVFITAMYFLMRTFDSVPAPHIDPWLLGALSAMFLIGGLTEELGWQTFLYDRLSAKRPDVRVAVAIGLAWALWHVVPYWQADRSWSWIAAQCAFTVGLRVCIVVVYEMGGRNVLHAATLHGMTNIVVFAYPVNGSHYSPAWAAGMMAAIMAILALFGVSRRLNTKQSADREGK